MKVDEQAEFLAAMAEASNLIRGTQAAVQRARSLCHGEVYDQVDLMSKRLYELKVKSAWVRFATLGGADLPQPDAGIREGGDRRLGIDRRVGGMQKQMLAALPAELAASSPTA